MGHDRNAVIHEGLRARRRALPPRGVPLLYIGFAYVSLALAFLAMALDPVAVAGFFYHARMLAVVHLVTLGWISASILGALYIVGPLALRTPMPARQLDYWAFACTAIGMAGMVAHFWIAEYSGMAWSGIMVAAGMLYVGGRLLRGLWAAPVQPGVKLHIGLAFINLLGAATLGVLLGFNKMTPFLPGFVLSNVFAHAHLAAIGWAIMMVAGVAYRLLPMVLPAAMPPARGLSASAWLLQAGVLGLFVTLLARSAWSAVFALVVIAGLAVFLRRVYWMRRHPRSAPAGRPRPDYAARHAAAALVYLGLAAAIGLALAIAPMSEWTLRIALAYGVFGLVGFLAQMVVGMESRLLPWLAWYWAFANTGFKGPVPPPDRMPSHGLQQAIWWLWLLGVPALAGGLTFNAVPFLAAGAWLLLAAVTLGAAQAIRVMRHGFTTGTTVQVIRGSRGSTGSNGSHGSQWRAPAADARQF
jgi:hypothetical protein